VTPSVGQRPVVWFIDTVSLISMAIDPRIDAIVQDEIAATGGTMMLIDIVRNELEYRAAQADTAALARGALDTIGPDWPWVSTDWVDVHDVVAIQDDVADGKALRDDYEHWAESTIILLCRKAHARGNALDVRFLSEDFDARRVANREPNITPLALPRLFRNRVRRGAMTATEAAGLSKLIENAGRGQEITEDDFLGPLKRLGRVGRP
jgi:hypothetical protein